MRSPNSSDGTVIGTRIKLPIHARAGMAVRSTNQARRIANGSPIASEPAVKSSVLRKSAALPDW